MGDEFTLSNWDDLRIFLAAARSGSISSAAKELSIDPTTVKRRLSAFEESVGEKLFDRIRGGILLSPRGELTLEFAQQIESVVLQLETKRSSSRGTVSGTVRVAIQEMLAFAYADLFAEIQSDYPDIRLEIVTADEFHNLSKRDADIAIRGTESPPEHLVGRKFGRMKVAVFGGGDLPAQSLQSVPWIGWSGLQDSETFTGEIRKQFNASGPYSAFVDSYGMLVNYVVAGTGVGVLPICLADKLRLSPMSEVVDTQILWVLTHPELQQTPRIRVVMDRIFEHLDHTD